jgi:hypothetical protein
LRPAGFTVNATADDFDSASTGVTLTSTQVVDLQIRRLYEGGWLAPAPASGAGGIVGNLALTVRNGSIVSVSFFHFLVAPGFIAGCSFSATVNSPIVKGAFSVPFSSRGLSSTFSGNFSAEGTGRGSFGTFSVSGYRCSTGVFSGTISAGGAFILSKAP